MATNDLTSFGRRIRLRAAQVEEGAAEAVKEAGRGVARALVESTPVDTGRAVSNWRASTAKAPRLTYREAAVPGEKGSTRQASIAEALGRMMRAIRSYKPGSDLTISNSAPYIRQLNAGSSTQAPAGFIELAIQRGRAAVRNVRIFK